VNPVVRGGRTNVNITNGSSIELISRFCYLGDVMLLEVVLMP